MRRDAPPVLTLREAVLRGQAAGGRIYIAGSAAEPCALWPVLQAEPELWAGKTVTGPLIPGVNDPPLPPGVTVEVIFATPGLSRHPGYRHLPLHYLGYWRRLATAGAVGLAYATLPPPRGDSIGLGLAADFLPAVLAAGAPLVALVNPAMPDPPGAPRLPLDRVAALVEAPGPLPLYDAGLPDPAMRAIAAHVVPLLRAGDTLQLGLGKLQGAILDRISTGGPRGLSYHAGMIAGPFRALHRDGIIGRVTTGVAMGDADLYEHLRADATIRYAPVIETHHPATLAALPALTSVNSVIEIDLTGQANAETLGGRQISGQGGLVDFQRGAALNPEGRGILALPATAKGISRIVPRLTPGTPVSVARADARIVVTEHGLADLAELGVHQRAQALIGLADPAHRAALSDAWDRMTRGLDP
jgi:hypothetical protein